MTDSRIHQADRVLVGHCPVCGRVLVILNNHEVWPYIECECGQWAGDTLGLANPHRIEYGFVINNANDRQVVRP